MKHLILFILGFVVVISSAQIVVTEKFILPTTIEETSGLIFYNGKLITHNDSGNTPQLFEIDTLSNTITRTITVTNANNIDWEDITQDDNYIYIGDIGNNNGSRTDLKIYRIDKLQYDTNISVTAEIIAFSYEDQIDFTPLPNANNWDAEALFSYNGKLYVCTKEWVSEQTTAYEIPIAPGAHTAINKGVYDVQGLITGATYSPDTGMLYLCGYSNLLQPFITSSSGISEENIFVGSQVKIALSSLGFSQIEGITCVSSNRYFLSSEKNTQVFVLDPKIYAFNTNDEVLDISFTETPGMPITYPNPVSDILYIKFPNTITFSSYSIYNMSGSLVKDEVITVSRTQIDFSGLQSGIYFMYFHHERSYSSLTIIKK
ncbi:T9SS type A sorting domain-containing protein [Leptobacterium sp. I13]|uniref:T9SS type A sorting domain-containing protein n=1 Tax=Leptobacterium meishanense TaxID=3128904 RepID=UPI0030ED7A66